MAAAQHLEGVQAEALAFILDEDALYAQIFGQDVQTHQRRGTVFGKALVKCLYGSGRFHAEGIALRHGVQRALDEEKLIFIHVNHLFD